jgi:glycosyltransferase involved in cell wall biosynthesis
MNDFNIAFEITSILDADGPKGSKSGVYRSLLNSITALADYLQKRKSSSQIFLYTLNPHLALYYNLNYFINFSNIKFIDPISYGFDIKNDQLLNKSEEINIDLYFKKISLLKNPIKFIASKAASKIYRFKNSLTLKEKQIRYFNFLEKFFLKNNVKIVHHSETGFIYFKEVKNVITFHDITPLTHPFFHREETKKIFARKIFFTKKYIDAIISVSKTTEKTLKTLFPKKTIKTIYNIIDYKNITNSASLSLAKINKVLKLKLKKENYLLCYATFEPRKNYLNFVKAAIKYYEESGKNKPEIVLAGGEGWLNIKNKLLDLLYEKYFFLKKSLIKILNFVPDQVLFSLIKYAKAVVYPSFIEGFGYQIPESQFLRKPVICSKIEVFREIGFKDLTYFFNPNDINDMKEKIFKHYPTKKINESEFKKYIEKFSPEKIAKEQFEFYQKLLSQ